MVGGMHSTTVKRIVLLLDVGCAVTAAIKRGRKEKAVVVQ